MEAMVHRKAHFNAVHRLCNKNWSNKKNLGVFGKCAYPNFHGHNYELILSVTGEIDPTTGFVFNPNGLKKIFRKEVEDYLDHRNLNLDIPEFQDLNPTVENIAVLIYQRIVNHLENDKKLKITLYETPRN